MDKAAVITKLKESPQSVLDAARNGSCGALRELAHYWHLVPKLQGMGVLEVFYGYLDACEAPDSEAPEPLIFNHACVSLMGLTHLGILANDKAGRQAAETLLKSWPGIFIWASYFFTVVVKPTAQNPQKRRGGMDMLLALLFAMCKQESMRLAVLATPGAMEMAACIWLLDDSITNGQKRKDQFRPSRVCLPTAPLSKKPSAFMLCILRAIDT